MNLDEARELLATNHHAVLATRRTDGRPQLSPVAVGVDDEGRVIISTRETAMKTHNLRRDPHASVCVFADAFYGPWAQIDGTAEVVSVPDALEGLVDYYQRVAGDHPNWDAYRAAMTRERRVLVRITMDAVGPTQSG
jgi:PPOX class probable F420-dependent enzyme